MNTTKSMILLFLAGTAMLDAQYVYLAHQTTNNISAYKVSTEGNLARIGTFPIGNSIGGPSSIAVDPLNRLFSRQIPRPGT